ncbi:hypothetical protein ES332_A01G001000v1 [Gossypium tomentosum]|uniref:Uncharacterized protein n=1 Tax=Gossypium tomentosum TaxID=34277 RepID=A0A5D2RKY3_GOSTO|nr:hypothetical protein ES332_A01G001000v1 [Gossypium tomentosum]
MATRQHVNNSLPPRTSDKWYQSFGCKVIEMITKTPEETTSMEVKKMVETLSTVSKGKEVVLKGKPMVSRLKATESHMDGVVATIEVPWWPWWRPYAAKSWNSRESF